MQKQNPIKDISLCFFIIVAIFCCHSCINVGYSKASCDSIQFFDDNRKNDTGRLVFEGRKVFDTTANQIYGTVVDSSTNAPIMGAKVYVFDGSKTYGDSTDMNGNFSFLKDDFSGVWHLVAYGDAHGYKCLQIQNIDMHGGLKLRIKLHKWLVK